MTASTSPPSSALLLRLLEMPVVSAGLQRAQTQGIAWAQRLKQEQPDASLDTLVTLAIRRSLWRSGASGALAGVGGVLSMATGGGDVLYFLYTELELAAAIFALHGVHLNEAEHRPILIGALLGLGANELIRLLGFRATEQAMTRLVTGLSGPLLQQLQQRLGERLSARLLGRLAPVSLRWLPVGGVLLGAGVNVLFMQAAGEAIRLTAREYGAAIHQHQAVEAVQVTVLDGSDT
jgi:hypothetical protein